MDPSLESAAGSPHRPGHARAALRSFMTSVMRAPLHVLEGANVSLRMPIGVLSQADPIGGYEWIPSGRPR